MNFSLHAGMIKSEKEAQMTFKETDSKDHIINALKNRVNDLEEMNKEAKQKNRCLICLVRPLSFQLWFLYHRLLTIILL